MSGKTGYTAISNGDAPNFGPDITSIAEHFDPLVGESVADAASLPSSDNWVNRTVMAEDTEVVYQRKSASWRVVTPAFTAQQTARTATSTISVASPTAPATLPTTAWTASVTPVVACKAKITIQTFLSAAAGNIEFGFTLSSGVTLAFDEFTPSGGSSTGAYAAGVTGFNTFSKIVDLPAAATTVTVVARQAGSAGAKTVGAGNLIIEPLLVP